MRVAVTGSHGLIGSALVESLARDGIHVVPVVRGAPGDEEIRWNPSTGDIAANAFNGIDAVVHLGGVGIADKRWSDAQKKQIVDSRRIGTDAIARACASATNGPKVLVSGSAVGFYSDTHGAIVDETDGPGDDFLADLCRAWEAATEPAAANGVRVVNIRTGIVQSRRGGMLAKQLRLFKLGLGGRLGSGKAWLSWISLEDEVRAIRFALDTPALFGPLNLTAPNPVTNREWTTALAHAVHRPAFLVVPPFALRLAMGGELVDSLLVSQRIVPRKLLDAGFVFSHPTIAEGLASAIAT